MKSPIYFVTRNKFKIGELLDYAEHFDVGSRMDVEFRFVDHVLQEILHRDLEEVVNRKAIVAYEFLRLPCLVEQGGLFLDALPGLPGTVGQVVWDAVGDRMCGFLRADDSRSAIAKSVLAYCDGRKVRSYCGETRGQVTEQSRGDYKFQWDPIFMPEGSDQTYGEMGIAKKRATSPTVRALDLFLKCESRNASLF